MDAAATALLEAGQHIFATKCWYIGASALVFFDYVLLFGNEVRYVWCRKFTLVTFLYLFVRYYSMIAIILDAVLIFDTNIDVETCKRAAFIEPILATMPLLASANTLLILRVRALYGQARAIPFILFCLMLSQIVVGMWIYLQPGKTVIIPPPNSSSVFIECINLPNPALGDKSAIYLFLETAFDSAVFLLTTYKTYHEVLIHTGRSRVRAILARDGIFYYGVIFASCLTWALMVIFAPPDLQYINAIPTNCLTAIMVCRITLNLREAGSNQKQGGWVNEPTFSLSTLRFSRSNWPLGMLSPGYMTASGISSSSQYAEGMRTGTFASSLSAHGHGYGHGRTESTGYQYEDTMVELEVMGGIAKPRPTSQLGSDGTKQHLNRMPMPDSKSPPSHLPHSPPDKDLPLPPLIASLPPSIRVYPPSPQTPLRTKTWTKTPRVER